MKAITLYSILFLFTSIGLFAQKEKTDSVYQAAFDEISAMLDGKQKSSFKRAVFITENAYWNNKLDYEEFDSKIRLYADLCRKISEQGQLFYEESDLEVVKKYAAIFRFMTDTVQFALGADSYFVTQPLRYDFDDFWGEKDWKKMFVTKLLETNKGNCHSLPFLYKILCEELGVKAYLAMAPNHTYIKLWCKKTGWFNTELTSGYFPIDAWIMASGYIHLSAVQNRLYMDTLSLKQSLAVCMVDLAKGYERKFPNKGYDFLIECADKALVYYPSYTNAILLKAETMKKIFESRMPARNTQDSEANRKLFEEMEKFYFQIYQLGYRPMPKEMYIAWLTDLKREREKYNNKDVSRNIKSAKQ